MKLAAIDIGSNSIHMVVAKIDGYGGISVIDRMKEMARLGANTLVSGELDEEAQQRGLRALSNLKRLADGHEVDDVVAVATSATREARNGRAFIRRIAEECDLRARIITGVEEGRLIYLGVREVYPIGDRRILIIDIGGGSVEFVLADARRDLVIRSLRLGVRRLKDRFLQDGATTEALRDLKHHIAQEAAEIVRQVRSLGYDVAVATSGTAASLAKVAQAMSTEELREQDVIPRDAYRSATDRIETMSVSEIAELQCVEPKRRDTLQVGAILLRELLDLFGAKSFTYVDAALREGMIVEYLDANRPGLRLALQVEDPRRRSVMLLLQRFFTHTVHTANVARIALRLFDDTLIAHRMADSRREWLEYAALLHNVGQVIQRSGHHKHSHYIIMHANLQGFTEREKAIIANVARYHRRSVPKTSHADFMALDPKDREIVKQLSAMLRLANALDRGHRGNVYGVSVDCCEGQLFRVRFAAHDDPVLELHAAEEQREFIRRVLGWDLEIVLDETASPLEGRLDDLLM